jgi:hypothetical protein
MRLPAHRPGIVRSFVLILTRNNGSELKTGQGGVEIISNYAWGISMTDAATRAPAWDAVPDQIFLLLLNV